jgi:hypothetical protein
MFNPEDALNAEHYGVMISECDVTGDGSLEICEIWLCAKVTE